jgi:1-deoxy-D-xylulose-5-phosphate synthase
MTLLSAIDGPQDLKNLSLEEMEQLCAELRECIIDTVNRNGGHLAPTLGVTELTVALHRVFDFDRDRLIWDVGHQCYAHKMLTGRRDSFDTLRKKGGLSGYPKMEESPYDAFGTGHSSTSISAGLGMALARDLKDEDHYVVAVIGDGALTGGMAFEALSHLGHLGRNMLVILNDNDMSISPSDGALSQYFNRIITAAPYKRAKEDVGSFVKKIIGNRATRTIQDLEKSVKGFITHGALFMELGINYLGPVDGHDLPMLIECLSKIKDYNGPVLLHCRTEKGKGLKEAEEDPVRYHGISPKAVKSLEEESAPRPPKLEANAPRVATFTDAFSEAMVEAATEDIRVVGITAAMATGTGLFKLSETRPDQFFDVGICEQHAVTLAAGLAAQGMRPVCAIYSTFLQRGYDQLIHDVCLQNLPVIFAIDRAGLVGEDSPTQAGVFDLSFLRAIPNLQILVPRDDVDLRLMLPWALQQEGPVAIRYARGAAHTIGSSENRNINQGEYLRHGVDGAFLAVGPVAGACLEAAEILAKEGLDLSVVDGRFVKSLDRTLLDKLVEQPLITVEENTLEGGFGSAVLEHVDQHGKLGGFRLLRMGIADPFCKQAPRAQQLAENKLDAAGLAASARLFLSSKVKNAIEEKSSV